MDKEVDLQREYLADFTAPVTQPKLMLYQQPYPLNFAHGLGSLVL